MRHIAFIPARKGSVGLPKKNQKLLDSSIAFLKQVSFFDDVVISSDDEEILSNPLISNFHKPFRPKALSGGDVSIKTLIKYHIDTEQEFFKGAYIWLIYLTIPAKKSQDYVNAKRKLEKYSSIISFVKANTHPFDAWKLNSLGYPEKYIDNDIFRRQDKPNAFEHHHYICAFDVKEINSLNNELVGLKTYPIILNYSKEEIIEIDSVEDLIIWKTQLADIK